MAMEGEEAQHADMVAEFCGITNATPAVASSLLSALDWQLENALELYFSDPDTAAAAAAGAGAAAPVLPAHIDDEPAQAAAQQAGQEADYVEILDDEDDEAAGAGLATLAQQRASALAARQLAEEAQDERMLSDAAAGPSSQAAARRVSDADASMELADDELAAVAAAVGAEGGDLGPAAASYHRRQQEELLAMYQRQAARQAGMAAAAPAAAAGDEPADMEGLGVYGTAIGAAGAADGPGGEEHPEPAGAAAAAGAPPYEHLDLPEGINLEEARMLEAALLGVPYAGRIPDFTAGAAAAAAPLSPRALEQQSIRREQDQAYEESLALDRAKQESLAAAAAEAEAAEQAQREAEEAAAAEAARAAEELQQLLAHKASRLPAEPSASAPGSLQVVVRLPTGSRKGRRFMASDPLQAVFDFVDVECAAAGAEGEGADSSCGIKPGSYRLVTQFPRKVFGEDGSSSSLQEVGLSADTALLVELV